MIRAAALAIALLAFSRATAHADDVHPQGVAPDEDTICNDAVVDPIVTPVRDVALDAQRGACLRDELSVSVTPHALIDTPGFHGVLGGDFAIGGRVVIKKAHELSAHVQLLDFTFVQNAVNKVTDTTVGPIVLGAAAGKPIGESARAALVLRIELPFTRDQMDTTRTSGEIAGVTTGRLTRWLALDARLSALGMVASSTAGRTSRLAFRAGADVVFQPRSAIGLQVGADLMAGWSHGFDDVLLRAGIHWAVHGGPWRFRAGAGAPVGGSERTNAIVDIALLHDL